jgi:Uma2 family endonuclease
MNEFASPPQHPTTQTADGLPRLRWSLAEFERLSDLGFFGGIEGPRERVELIDGELLPMHAKGGRHEWVRGEIQHYLSSHLGAEFRSYSEPGWRPGGDLYLEPEMIVCRAGFRPATVPPTEVLLLVEVADSSLAYDRGLKARIYARLGVAEYWVVNARTLETHVHLSPAGEGYTSITAVGPRSVLRPSLLPHIEISLGSLGLD